LRPRPDSEAAAGGFVDRPSSRTHCGRATPLKAWREHLGLTQADVAQRLGVTQSAYAQQENSQRLRKSSREKIAAALGILQEQLHF